MSYPKRPLAVLAVLGLTGAGAAVTALAAGGDAADTPTVNLRRTAPVALQTRRSCDDLLRYYRSGAAKTVGPYGLGGGPGFLATDGMAAIRASMAESQGVAAAKAAADPGQDQQDQQDQQSTTNVQVEGVDESDQVKTVGDLMVSVVDGTVRITRLAGARTKTIGTWKSKSGGASSLLLDGTRAVVIGSVHGGVVPLAAKMRSGFAPSASTALTLLDLSDPTAPRAVRRLEIDGDQAGDVRLVGGEIRLALTTGAHGLTWRQPVFDQTRQDQSALPDRKKAQNRFDDAERAAEKANQDIAAKSGIGNWIPQITVTELNGDQTAKGAAQRRPLVDCSRIAVPDRFSGLETLTLVSADLLGDDALKTTRAAGVVAAGSTLYATAGHAWLATSRWNEGRGGDIMPRWSPVATDTQLHLFDTPVGGTPEYAASGQVEGSLLNQFALDERDGVLRVASTTASRSTSGAVPPAPSASARAVPLAEKPGSGPAAPIVPAPTRTTTPTQARVTVLRPEGHALVQVGLVTGLGRGEQIRGVRFLDDVAYVVTYRQTDPLYTIDLSDPAHPTVRGELKVEGYSAYLHPAGDGRLLGLGQNGTAGGSTTGLQLSLFDVGDLAAPRRLATRGVAGAWSDAEADHHAFTMAGDLVLIPYTRWDSLPPTTEGGGDGPAFRTRFDAGVIAVRVEQPGGLGAAVTLRPIADGPVVYDEKAGTQRRIATVTSANPLRTVVRAGTVYTLTPTGLAAHGGADLHRLTFAAF